MGPSNAFDVLILPISECLAGILALLGVFRLIEFVADPIARPAGPSTLAGAGQNGDGDLPIHGESPRASRPRFRTIP
jgi:hypothetical protein